MVSIRGQREQLEKEIDVCPEWNNFECQFIPLLPLCYVAH